MDSHENVSQETGRLASERVHDTPARGTLLEELSVHASKFALCFPVVVKADGTLDKLMKKGRWEKLTSLCVDLEDLRAARHPLSPASKYEYLKPILCGKDGEVDRTLVFAREWERLKQAYDDKHRISTVDRRTPAKESRTPPSFCTPSPRVSNRPRESNLEAFADDAEATTAPTWRGDEGRLGGYSEELCHNQVRSSSPCFNELDPHEAHIWCYTCRSAFIKRKIKRSYTKY